MDKEEDAYKAAVEKLKKQYFIDIQTYFKERREPYIKKRNEILNNPFKYYNPFYRRKLKEIELILNDLDSMEDSFKPNN
jgi:hypothetical protein